MAAAVPVTTTSAAATVWRGSSRAVSTARAWTLLAQANSPAGAVASQTALLCPSIRTDLTGTARGDDRHSWQQNTDDDGDGCDDDSIWPAAGGGNGIGGALAVA